MYNHYVQNSFQQRKSGVSNSVLLLIVIATILIFTSCDIFSSDDEESEQEISYTLSTNISDPLLLSAVHQNGDSVAYYGTRNEQGVPQSIFGATVFQNGETFEIETGGLQSLPSRITADAATFEFDWETTSDVVIKTIDNETGERTQIAFDLTDIPEADYPPSSKAKQKDPVVPGSATRSEKSCPDSEEILKELKLAAEAVSGDSLRAKLARFVLVKVERCGVPIKDARVRLSMQQDLESAFQLVGVSQNLGDGSYLFKVPHQKGSTIATSISDLCSGTVKVAGAGCPAAKQLALGGAAICANIALRTGPAAPKVFVACEAAIASYVLFCNTLNWSPSEGLPPGTPSPTQSPIQYVCSAIKELDRGFTSSNIRFKATATINSSQGLRVSEAFSGIVPINSGSPDLDISFSGAPEATSFTASPGNPPAGVGYTATATLSCVVPGSEIQLSVVGTDGYEKDNVCISDDEPVQTCTLSVPGAGEGGVEDVITIALNGDQIGQPLKVIFGD